MRAVVRDYGAKADGMLGGGGTDNTAAFRRAQAVVKQAGGGEVVVPSGTYRLSSASTYGPGTIDSGYHVLLASGVAWVGEGMGATTIIGGCRTASPFLGYRAEDVGLRDLTLAFDPAALQPSSDGIKALGLRRLRLARVRVLRGYIGFQIRGCVDSSLEDCAAEDQATPSDSGGASQGFVVSDFAYRAADGSDVLLVGTDNVTLTRCVAERSYYTGFQAIGCEYSGIRYAPRGVRFDGCTARDCAATDSSTGFWIEGADALALGCRTDGCHYGFLGRGAGVALAHCTAAGSSGRGYHLDGALAPRVEDCAEDSCPT